MAYEAPKIFDLGQVTKHVFEVTPPDRVGDEGFEGGVISYGSSGGMAGLSLIGGLAAALSSRGSNKAVNSDETSEDEPEPDRANER